MALERNAIKLIRFFVKSAAFLLLITATAKLISTSGDRTMLRTFDPVFGISFRYLFWVIGAIELMVALVCLLNKSAWLQMNLVAWLATGIAVYRLGYSWLSYEHCPCLGTLTAALNIPPEKADSITMVILVYLLAGSYTSLFWLRLQEKRPRSSLL